MKRRSIKQCFTKPVIPVVWDPSDEFSLISKAGAVILQGGEVADLPRVLDIFQEMPDISLFVHIDLLSGLENSDAGLHYLAGFSGIEGVVTVHHHLSRPARRLGLKTIVRLFITDSRAVDRGLAVIEKSQADSIEILPAVAAVKVASDFAKCKLPRIAGGLCHTEQDIEECLASGCMSATSTRPELWRMNCD